VLAIIAAFFGSAALPRLRWHREALFILFLVIAAVTLS
jgi:hypothetical protein